MLSLREAASPSIKDGQATDLWGLGYVERACEQRDTIKQGSSKKENLSVEHHVKGWQPVHEAGADTITVVPTPWLPSQLHFRKETEKARKVLSQLGKR